MFSRSQVDNIQCLFADWPSMADVVVYQWLFLASFTSDVPSDFGWITLNFSAGECIFEKWMLSGSINIENIDFLKKILLLRSV